MVALTLDITLDLAGQLSATELQEAINATADRVRGTSASERLHKILADHLQMLLAVQGFRAKAIAGVMEKYK